MLCAVFVQMAGNSIVDVPRCDTSWYELFDGFRDDGDRGDSTFRLVESEGDGMTVEIGWERKLVTGAPGEKKNDHTARNCE